MKVLRAGAVVTTCSMLVVIGLPQIAGADVTLPDGTDITAVVATVESTLNTVLGDVIPEITALSADLTKVEADLAPLESKLNLTPAVQEALAAAVLVETGPLFSNTCSAIANLEKNLPVSVLGIPLSVAEALGLTGVEVQEIDAYLDGVLATETHALIAGIAPSSLSLLQINWNSSFTPPGGSPITRSMQGYVGVPTLLDVDGSAGLDLCADLSVSSAGVITEQIVKLPLAASTLPVDVSAVLPSLGNIGIGYSTKGSTVPLSWTSAIGGATGTGGLAMSNNVVSPGPSLTEVLSLGTDGNLDYTWAPVPSAENTGLGSATGGFAIPNLVSSPTKFTFGAAFGSALSLASTVNELQPTSAPSRLALTLPGIGLNASFTGGGTPSTNFTANVNLTSGTTVYPLTIAVSPLPTSFDSCAVVLTVACSNVNAARGLTGSSALTALSSMHFTSSSVATTTQSLLGGASCAASAATQYAQVTGTDIYSDFTVNSSLAGHAWLDTGGTPVSGCTQGADLSSTFPAGTASGGASPSGRLGTFTVLGLTANSLTKSGSMVCPTGTAILLGTTNVNDLLCPTPPTFSKAPVLSPLTPAYVAGPETVTAGTVTPANMPITTSYQWQRCSTSCTNIADTTNTYTPVAGDVGDALQVTVTATNADGSVSSTTAQTAAVTEPPAPSPLTAPKISDTPHPGTVAAPGDTLSTTNGTWANAPSTFGYQWYDCTAADVCSQINGATNQTYLTTSSDEGFFLQSEVTASNVGGSATQTSSNQILVPLPVTNTTPPNVTDSGSNATGQTVLQGDALGVNNGTWTPANGNIQFTYQWEDCDSGGGACTSIPGATSGTYTTQSSDVGDTIAVVVTGTDAAGSASVTTAATGVVQANSLAPQALAEVPDGTVDASAPSGHGTVFVGGSFDTVGPAAGDAALLPSGYVSGGSIADGADATGGSVNAVEPDGSGGYFIGGSFTAVQGTACDALAHITTSGSLDPAYCGLGLSGTVNALDLVNSLLAVGGLFTDGSDSNLAFVTVGSSPSVSFSASGDPNLAVNAITDDRAYAASVTALSTTNPPTVTPPALFVGGAFTQIGTTAAGHLAKFATSVSSGTVATQAWPASVLGTGAVVDAISASDGCSDETTATAPAVPGPVNCWALPFDQIVVGGSFNQALSGTNMANAKTHLNAAEFGGGSAAALSTWEPDPNGVVTSIASVVSPTLTTTAVTAAAGKTSYTVVCSNTSVYLGGQFQTIGLGAALAHVQNAGEFGLTYQTATSISFLASGPEPSSAPSTAYASPSASWAPGFGGTVNTLLAGSDGNIYAGGPFTTVTIGTSASVRHRLAAVTPAGVTLGLKSWDPNAGNTVDALAQDSFGTYVGGSFLVVGGQTRNNAAEFAGPAGSPADDVTSWNPGVTGGPVDAIAVGGGNVYLGGSFTAVGGSAQSGLAEVDASGARQSWNPSTNGTVHALAVSGGNVYIGGSFSQADGNSGVTNAAEVDGVAGMLSTAWAPDPNGPVYALVASGGNVYLGGQFSQVDGHAAANVAEVDAGTGALGGWTAGTDGQVNALALIGSTVYIGGSFANVDGTPSANLAAVDDTAGQLIPGWSGSADGTVNSLVGTSSTLYVGGAFANVDSVGRSGLAGVSTSSGALTAFNPGSVNGPVLTLARTSDGTLMAGGTFSEVGTQLTGGLAVF